MRVSSKEAFIKVWVTLFQYCRNGFLPARQNSWKDRVRPIKWKLERERLLSNLTSENFRFLVARARHAGQWFHEGK